MDVLYSAVVEWEGPRVVAEYATPAGSGQVAQLRAVALAVAAQAKPGDRVSVTAGGLAGHYIARQDQLVVAIAEEVVPRRVCFGLLANVVPRLPLGGTDGQRALERAHQEVNTNRDSILGASTELDAAKKVVVESVDRLLERGERLNTLVDRTGEMSSSARQFRQQATQVQRRFWWQNMRFRIIGGLVAAGLLALGVHEL